MAATTLTALPTALMAGDTLLMSVILADYPADEGWTLTYSFRADGGSKVEFASTPDGAKHAFTVGAGETAAWLPAVYSGAGFVEDTGGQRFTVWQGEMEIKFNVSIQPDNFDTRSTAKKILDYIDAAAIRVAKKDVASTTIEGISLTFKSMDDIAKARAYWGAIYGSEQLAKSGGGTRNIFCRFN